MAYPVTLLGVGISGWPGRRDVMSVWKFLVAHAVAAPMYEPSYDWLLVGVSFVVRLALAEKPVGAEVAA